jgi:hypothetical protein
VDSDSNRVQRHIRNSIASNTIRSDIQDDNAANGVDGKDSVHDVDDVN